MKHALPGFDVFLVVLVLVVFILVLVVFVLVLEIVVELVVKNVIGHHDAAGGAGFSRLGGGYVDQKWRPHFGQTQN